MTAQEFLQACANGRFDQVEQGLAEGLDPLGDPGDTAPLHEAAEGGHLTVVQRLLDAGVPVDHRLRSHGTSVLLTGLYGGTPMLSLLLAAGATVRPENHRAPGSREGGLVPAAAHHDDPVPMARLLAAGADPTTIDQPLTGRNALHVAAWLGHARLIPLLARHGLPLQAVDAMGFTALHWAVRGSHDRAVKALLDLGADVLDAGGTVETPWAMVQNAYAHPVLRTMVEDAARIAEERTVLVAVLDDLDDTGTTGTAGTAGTQERGRRRL